MRGISATPACQQRLSVSKAADHSLELGPPSRCSSKRVDRRTVLQALAATLAGLAAGGFSRGVEAADFAQHLLDGRWQLVSAELSGTRLPMESFPERQLVMTGGLYRLGSDEGRYVIRLDEAPFSLDVTGLSGPNAGRTIPAIFAERGSRLLICYDLSGQQRPRTFRSHANSQHLLAFYRREEG